MCNSLDKLRHPRSDAYSAEQVLLNKQQLWCGEAYPDCYLLMNKHQILCVTSPWVDQSTTWLTASCCVSELSSKHLIIQPSVSAEANAIVATLTGFFDNWVELVALGSASAEGNQTIPQKPTRSQSCYGLVISQTSQHPRNIWFNICSK